MHFLRLRGGPSNNWLELSDLLDPYKVVVLFEDYDAAGNGGVIKHITQRPNPPASRLAALPTPSKCERMLGKAVEMGLGGPSSPAANPAETPNGTTR
jgi:Polyphosphate kinase 2 (PPK2)